MNNNVETTPARVFVGLKIASDIADRLADLASKRKETRARLVAPADIHLTLVPPWQEASIEQAVERLRNVVCTFAPFSLEFRHLGYGPKPRRPSLLWVDCVASEEIAALRTALMHAFGQEDTRPFRPHVTLARIRAADQSFARRHPIDKDMDLAQTVRTVELFRSPPPCATGYRIIASLELGANHVSAAAEAPPDVDSNQGAGTA